MKYTQGIQELSLPEIYRFGIELEAFNVNTSLGSKSLYHSKESNEFLKQHRWKKANFLEESLVGEGGAELVSPILYDKIEDWQNLQEVCEHMQKYPGKHGKEVVADEKCGCHIHFDSRTLSGKTKEESQAIMGNFLSLWAESEELIYKMCNDVNSPIRSGTLNVKGNPIHRLSLAIQGVKGMAMPTGKKIHEASKLENLLNLLFENEQEQDIYRKRWESVRNAEVFRDNEKRGFAPNRFQREEFEQIAKRTPATRVKQAFAKLKGMLQEKKEIT